MRRRPALLGALVAAFVSVVACSGSMSSEESLVVVSGSVGAGGSGAASTTAPAADVTNGASTAETLTSTGGSSIIERDYPGELLAGVRADLLSTLDIDTAQLDRECRVFDEVDYCFEVGLADLSVSSETCALVDALPNTTTFEAPAFTALDVECTVVGTVPGACFFVQVLGRQDGDGGYLQVRAFAPEDWRHEVIENAALIAPYATGQIDSRACIPT